MRFLYVDVQWEGTIGVIVITGLCGSMGENDKIVDIVSFSDPQTRDACVHLESCLSSFMNLHL